MNHHTDIRNDATLVALVLAGERETFTPLLLRHYTSVARLCRRLLGPTPEAQDIAQEAALQAFLRLGELQDAARFSAWLHAIAANLARMELRRRRTLSLDAVPDGVAMIVLWAAGSHTPEEVHAARELHDTIVAALSELSNLNREVVIGFYLDGYSYAELAELLGVPVSTVKGRLFKGRRQLRRTLALTAHEVLKPDHRLRKEHLMEASELVEVTIESIRTSQLALTRVVVLGEQGGERLLPIWIGSFEADAIQQALEGTQPPRPMTHDLALQLFKPLGGTVQQIVINRIADETFYAEIMLVANGQTHVIDARPSDAIALAVRSSAPIYVARSVFDTVGTIELDERFKQDEQHLASSDPAMARSTSGERTWVLSLEARTEPTSSNTFPLIHFTSTDWPSVAYQRDIEWEGRQMLAIQLPGADENAAWLIATPTLWDQFPATIMRFAPPTTPPQPDAGGAISDETP
jgi:RNA polymerase sigma factor (sigma-70 family)